MKKGICLAAVLIMLLSLCGCTPLYAVLNYFVGDDLVAQAEEVTRIAFSNGDVTDTTDIVALSEFETYEITYSSYRSAILFDSLNETEQLVYRAYEYALENGFTNILFDDAIGTDEERLPVILEMLALDSPLLEQNLRYDVGEFTIYYPLTIMDLYERELSFTGQYITVYNFESCWWDEKQTAIQKAEEIVATLDKDASDADKAEQLYRYVCDHVTYAEYTDDDNYTVYPYLADALLRGETHCDGFANALSLLYRLAGIDCVEKQYTKGENDPGHTWNCAPLDGVWYNFDATLSSWVPDEECSMHAGIGFAFPDTLQTAGADHRERYPVCESSLYMMPDAHLETNDSYDFVEAVVEAYYEHDNEWALILTDTFSEDAVDNRMQQIANRLYTTIYYTSVPVTEGRTSILIYSGGLYEHE